jgi:hypothetical protein
MRSRASNKGRRKRSMRRDPVMTMEPLWVGIDRIEWLDEGPAAVSVTEPDPGLLMLTCANCGATMDELKCRLICRCGYFLSCSDYY